jgi:hypothetical protein
MPSGAKALGDCVLYVRAEARTLHFFYGGVFFRSLLSPEATSPHSGLCGGCELGELGELSYFWLPQTFHGSCRFICS